MIFNKVLRLIFGGDWWQHNIGDLDPYVATVLASEPPAMQRTLIGILAIMKEIASAKG